MGNGIKMRSAVDATGRLYPIEELHTAHDANAAIPNLLCADPICRKPVRYVPRHQQNRKNRIEPVDVPAYIGLTSGSMHADGCKFDAVKRIALIVDESDPDFVGALDEGKRDLRLLVLHNGLSGKPLSGNALVPPGGAGAGSGMGTKTFTPSGKKLDSYLRTTSDLLALRELCESDAVLAAQLILRFGTKRIAWSNFFFTKDGYDEAWELLHKAGGNAHPLALVAEVKSHFSSKPDAKYKSTFLNCRSLYRKTDIADTIESFEVSVLHADAAWLGSFPVGSNIIMFGIWEYKAATETHRKAANDDTRTITYITHKLTLKPRFKQQILAAS
ncbi:hypothetical protein ACHAC9_13505 [Massilia sp. CMS3.1]|uniref:hypothetical protein n=1 Tax=Massilia sp. CMS3.1 TaxID=3373083 RepID=UPI003EE6FD31